MKSQKKIPSYSNFSLIFIFQKYLIDELVKAVKKI